MATKKIIKANFVDRLTRFEALAGLEYSFKACDVWWEKFKDWDVEEFCKICEKVENKIKWHILPTPVNLFEEKENSPRYNYNV